MKILKILFVFIILPTMLMSQQIPYTFNYQTTVRNSDGDIRIMTDVEFDIELIQNGETVYSEQHTGLNTGKIGVVNLKIGTGDTNDDFAAIDWSQGNLSMKISFSVDDGEEQVMPESELVAVPFALYAENSGKDNDWNTSGDSIVFTTNKNVGIGINTPNYPLHIVGNNIRLDGINDADLDLNITTPNINNPEVRFRVNGESKGYLRLQQSEDRMILHESLSSNPTVIALKGGRVGVNTSSPSSELHLRGILRVDGIDTHQKIRLHTSSSTLDNRITSYDENGDLMWWVFLGDRDNNDDYVIDRPGNGFRDFYIDTDGTTHVRVLQIHGGGDIKEDLNSAEELEPGDVVVIDENNPGKIRKTSKAYDKKVAGIISGANGVKPGLSLSQEDVLEGDYPLTMLGRVYVKVTGKVRVGDMLTTSSKPGYAKTAKKKSKSHGAVIGKAMTSNAEGDGLVLVLVNLQ